MKREEAIAKIEKATSPREVFTTAEDVKTQYRRYARHVHPDRGGGKRANEAFVKLQALYSKALKDEAGIVTIRSKGHLYDSEGLIARGDIANVYHGHDENGKQVIIKAPRSPRDNDLMEREARALKRFLGSEEHETFHAFVPWMVETFRLRDSETRAVRRVNVMRGRTERLYTLTDVMRAYPDGLDPRDVAWMWRRLLMVLGFAQNAGVIHGAVVPSNVLIQPEKHGLVLVDWCYSVIDGAGTVPAIAGGWINKYAPEVLAKETPGPEADIFMATKTMMGLVAPGDCPRALRAYATGCTLQEPKDRPQSAWQAHDEFMDLIKVLWGPRRFRPFAMPSKVPA
jgi:serine/threonine protein kinase